VARLGHKESEKFSLYWWLQIQLKCQFYRNGGIDIGVNQQSQPASICRKAIAPSGMHWRSPPPVATAPEKAWSY